MDANELDQAAILRAQRELYEAGRYDALSNALLPAARDLIEACSLGRGDLVLDVATGDGSVAELARSEGARVVACDLSEVQARRAVTRLPDLAVVAADAGRLPFVSDAFDAVVSGFGAMYAPDPLGCAAELFRVCRPGGVVALTAWPPDSLTAELNAAVRTAAPDPGRFPDQELEWGVPEVAEARFARHAECVTATRRSFILDPVVRAAAGSEDCATRYVAAHLPGVDLGGVRQQIVERHRLPGGLRADFLLVVGNKKIATGEPAKD